MSIFSWIPVDNKTDNGTIV